MKSILSLLLLLFFAGCADQADNRSTSSNSTSSQVAHSSSPSLLYAVTGTGGVYTESRLEISGSGGQITYFSDRPERQSGILTVEKFIEFWDSKGMDSVVQDDPPNAILTLIQPDGTTKLAVMEVQGAELRDSLLIFTIDLLMGEIPASFNASSLVIDAIPTQVNGQITD